jgi:hypothetical protein
MTATMIGVFVVLVDATALRKRRSP